MSNPGARTGEEAALRAIVFKEGDLYIAQCLEYDICAQASDLQTLLDKLDLTVEAEFATCRQQGKSPKDLIGQAPNYYHGLWDKRSIQLQRMSVAIPDFQCGIEVALAAA